MKSGQSGHPDQPGPPLLELLLTEVVPRLTRLACGPGPSAASSDRSAWPGRPVASMNLGDGPPQVGPLLVHALELAEFCEHGRVDAATGLIERLREGGVPIEAVFLQVIQPAAQHLGQGWSDDRLSFTDVTIGLGHLQQLFSSLLDEFQVTATPDPSRAGQEGNPPSAYFCTMPGATHRLGVQMVRAFFARAGWRTRLGHGDEATLISQITAMRPALIGLSLNSETDLRSAGALILRVRNACRSFRPSIMVGGAAVPFFPRLVERLDADIVSGDATDALDRATRLLTEHSVGTR